MSDKIDDLVKNCKEYAQIVMTMTGKNVENDDLEAILRRDAIAEAENLSKEIPEIDKTALSLGNSFLINERKNELLKQVDDTLFSDELDRYHRIVEELGFEKVLEIDFYSNSSDNDEKYYIFWRSNGGLLLSHDTFRGRVNGGNVYFNWKRNPGEYFFPDRVSGGYSIKDRSGEVSNAELYPPPNYELTTDEQVLARKKAWDDKWNLESIFCGYFDCREALRRSIARLESSGTFVNPWEDRPFLWLVHHGEKDKPYKEINENRILQLPLKVRTAITPES